LKDAREYTARQRDIHEADHKHLEQAAAIYDRLAKSPNWATIECASPKGNLLSPELIHSAVLDALKAHLPGFAASGKGAD
jgi:hypothetical protein